MARIAKRTVVALAFLLVAASPAMAVNILLNSGFENGDLAPWFQGRDFTTAGPWEATMSDAHNGDWSAFVAGNREIRQDFTAVASENVNELSLWLRMPGGPPAISFVTTFYDDNTENGDTFNIGTDWTFVDFTSLLVGGKNLVGIGVFGCNGCGGEQLTFLDDALVDARVPAPATLLLLIPGLVAVRTFRRR